MELVSGPDVGGGFLFQLTRVRAEPLATYTVHAQDGGLDGGNPPAGTPADVGFRPAAGMCPIGGRRCYHREFAIPLAENSRVRFAYNRLRFVIGPMLEQRVGRRPVGYAEGIATTLSRIAGALGPTHIPWMVGGSTAAALRGAAIAPRDVDLLTGPEGVDAIAGALEEFLVEPPAVTAWGDEAPRRAARAFVGTLTDGLRVEWAEPPVPAPAEWSAHALQRPERVRWGELEVPVAPIEYALANALRAANAERTRAILAVRPPTSIDRGLLDALLEDAAEGRARAHEALGN